MKITASEKACKDMADVCELAHKRTVKECNRLGIKWDKWNKDHRESSYYARAQEIFNRHYDYICNITGI